MIAFSNINFDNISNRHVGKKSPGENTGEASDLFSVMLNCIRSASPESKSTGDIALTVGKSRSARLSAPLNTAHFKGHAKNEKSDFRMGLNPGMMAPDTKTVVQKAAQTIGALGKIVTAAEIAHSSRKNMNNGSSTTALSNVNFNNISDRPIAEKPPAVNTGDIALTVGKSRPARLSAPLDAPHFKGLSKKGATALPGKTDLLPKDKGNAKNEKSDFRMGLNPGMTPDTKTVVQKAAPTIGALGKIVTAAEIAHSSGENMSGAPKIPDFPDDGLKQSRSAQKFHPIKNTAIAENFKTATVVKTRNAGRSGERKNDLMKALNGGNEEKRADIKSGTSEVSGGKMVFTPEKTADSKLFDPENGFLAQKISGPAHPVDHMPTTGEYLPGPLQGRGETTGATERLNNSGIDSRALVNQIATQAGKTGRVRIALTPPRMGTLDMEVIVRENKVQVILKTESNDVWQALKSNSTGLESALRHQGLVVDTIQVSVQEKFENHNFGFGQNGAAFKEGSNQESHSGTNRGEPDVIEYGLAGSPEKKTDVRMDGRISLVI